MVLKSYAKLNLYLEVLNKRRDNYHNIKTVFERIDLYDKIVLKARRDKKIKIISDSAAVPCGKSNLAYRSAKLLQDSFNLTCGVDIELTKHIPVASGLGGGSSNAACALVGLNKLWRLNLNQHRLLTFAKKIGCDVPFFIYDYPFALGEGRGDRIKVLKTLKKIQLWHILIVPKIKVSTPIIYKEWDLASCAKVKLTRPKYDVKILSLLKRKKDFTLIAKLLFNSLEDITPKLYPQLEQVKERLEDLGLKSILMSGSGPAIFGMVHSRKEAKVLSKQLKRENRSWQIYVTRTI